MTNELTKMEISGMKNGCFPMDKNAGVEACIKYRSELEAQGFKTFLEHLWCGIYKAIPYKTIEELNEKRLSY